MDDFPGSRDIYCVFEKRDTYGLKLALYSGLRFDTLLCVPFKSENYGLNRVC